MAAAMKPVLSRKYTVAAPTSGRAIIGSGIPLPTTPPSSRNARPAPCTVTTSDAMLNATYSRAMRGRRFMVLSRPGSRSMDARGTRPRVLAPVFPQHRPQHLVEILGAATDRSAQNPFLHRAELSQGAIGASVLQQ